MRNRKRNRVIDFIVAFLSTVRSRKIPRLIQQKSLAIRSLDASVRRAKRCRAFTFAKPSENGKLLLRRVRLKKGVPCGLAILMNWLKLRILCSCSCFHVGFFFSLNSSTHLKMCNRYLYHKILHSTKYICNYKSI